MTRPHHWPQVQPYGAQQRPVWPAGLAECNPLFAQAKRLYPASRLVQSITGLPLSRNKAVVRASTRVRPRRERSPQFVARLGAGRQGGAHQWMTWTFTSWRCT